MFPFDATTEAELRERQSAKWRHYPADVLPAWVAEMDFPLASPIRRVLARAIEISDCGYATATGVGEAFAPWALSRYGWSLEPSDVSLAPDVVTAITELLHVTTERGDGVVIDPPVYPPFAGTVHMLGRKLHQAPLAPAGDGWVLDLDAIEQAYRAGARVHVFCSPHNPAGTVHARETLIALAALADHYGVLVLSDEIHAPLTFPGTTHHPFPTVSDVARERSIVITSASKAWNLAGLKAALMIASADGPRAVLKRLPPELPYHAGHLGVLAAKAAFSEGNGWLDTAIAHLDRNRRRLGELLSTHLPEVRYHAPDASYLAWLDCRALGLGNDPARTFLSKGRVALSPGPTFGTGGDGFARLNFATTATLLEESVRRMAVAVAASR